MNAESGRAVELERGHEAPPRGGLRGKLKSVFVLQLVAIGIATLLSVYCAWIVLRDVLIQQALIDEAAHFESRLERDPAAPPPDMFNMRGFLAEPGAGSIPPQLRDLGPGYHTVVDDGANELVHVSDTPRGRLYLVFDAANLDRLALWFGFVPLSMALLVIYIATWLSYRVTRQAISPLVWLAKEVRALDPKHPDLSVLEPARLPADADVEVQTLALALHGFASRLEDFVERERNFTRDASHELRSPLTVVKLATDVLLSDPTLPPFTQRSLKRIQRATRDMEALFEALLIMAREDDVGLPEEDFVVNAVTADEIAKARVIVADRPIEVVLVEAESFALHAPRRVFSVVLANLLRSAFAYTEAGVVTVTVGKDCVQVQDNGAGMTSEELAQATRPFVRGKGSGNAGHGIGLTIVKRLADRFGWGFEIESALGRGTHTTIRFPHPQPV